MNERPASVRRRALRPLFAIGLPLAFGASIAACGIPTGESSFKEIPAEEIPFDLDETSTSTSTTTTTTTIPVAPQTTVFETTTTIPFEEVDIYFLSRGKLQPVPYALPRDFGADQVVALLEDGPQEGAAGVGLETLIEQGLITSTEKAGGVVTVDLDPEIFGRIPSFDQSEAIGQIVLTLTSNLRGVGPVLFTLGGEPTQVKKGNGLLSGQGEPVSGDDYRVLLVTTSASAEAQADTTTTGSPTTEPPPPTESAPPDRPLGTAPAAPATTG